MTKPSIIIIEGPDGAGKSSLLRLLKSSGYSSFHCTSKTDNSFEWYKQQLLTASNIIFDRFFYSEMVYSRVFKRTCTLTSEQFAELNKLANEKAEIIYVHNNINVLRKRLQSRGEDFIELSMLGDILDLYEEYLLHTRCSRIQFNLREPLFVD